LGFDVLWWLKIVFHEIPLHFAVSKAPNNFGHTGPNGGVAKDPPMAGSAMC
jgi:hypothetical protein